MRRTALRSAVVVAAGALALGGCGDLGRSELRRGVESLGSIAGEGALVADGVAVDRTKASYVRVQSQTLAGDAQHEAEKLADATPQAGFGPRRDRAVDLAGEISDTLSELQTYPGDERRGRAAARRLRRLQSQTDVLVGRL